MTSNDVDQLFRLPAYQPLTPAIRAELGRALGEDAVISDPDRLKDYAQDSSHLRHVPELVVLAHSAAQVQAVLRLANEHLFPVIPRGAGTGVAGGALARLGGVVLSLEGMTRIKEVSQSDLVAVVEPGVIVNDLKKAAKAKGLFYPPDPASLEVASLGGTAATNAGGPACLKYGVTRDYILGLEAVLPTGELIKAGVRTRKGVVGYDLAHLLVGSEGTLGVITSLTLKLIPHPPGLAGLVALFPDLERAMGAVSGIMTQGYSPSVLELMDQSCLHLVHDLLPFDTPRGKGSLLYIECDGPPEVNLRDMEAIGGICRQNRATALLPAPEQKERDIFWGVRRQMSERIKEASVYKISLDVAVPMGRIVELAAYLPGLEKEYDFKMYAFGHAGDGNIHLNVSGADQAGEERAWLGVKRLLEKVIALGGTISGEHGVGEAKAEFLPLEIQPESIRLQASLKRLFDPNLILNPGKLFPWLPAGAA